MKPTKKEIAALHRKLDQCPEPFSPSAWRLMRLTRALMQIDKEMLVLQAELEERSLPASEHIGGARALMNDGGAIHHLGKAMQEILFMDFARAYSDDLIILAKGGGNAFNCLTEQPKRKPLV